MACQAGGQLIVCCGIWSGRRYELKYDKENFQHLLAAIPDRDEVLVGVEIKGFIGIIMFNDTVLY